MKSSTIKLHGIVCDELFWIPTMSSAGGMLGVKASLDLTRSRDPSTYVVRRSPLDAVVPLDRAKAKIWIEVYARHHHRTEGPHRSFTGVLGTVYDFAWTIELSERVHPRTVLNPEATGPQVLEEDAPRRSTTLLGGSTNVGLYQPMDLEAAVAIAVRDLQLGIMRANAIVEIIAPDPSPIRDVPPSLEDVVYDAGIAGVTPARLP